MPGLEKIKIYEYNKKGKFIQEFNSMAAFRASHYPTILSKPIFLKSYKGIKYQLTPNDTLAFQERPGREFTVLLYKITKSKYCNLNKSNIDGKPVQVLNLKQEVLAEFKSIVVASLLIPSISKVTMDGQIKRNKNFIKHFGSRELIFRYKPD